MNEKKTDFDKNPNLFLKIAAKKTMTICSQVSSGRH